MEIKLDQNKAIKLAEKQTAELADDSRIKVVSGPTFEKAKTQLIQVKKIKSFVKEQKESITKPLHQAKVAAMALFKPFEEKVSIIEKYLNSQLMEYNQKLLAEKKKREEEAAKKIRIEQEAKDKAEREAEALRNKENKTKEEEKKLKEVEAVAEKEVDYDAATRKLSNTEDKISQIRTRKVKRFRIVDANKIPREYLILNEVLVKAAMNNNEIVDGVQFYTEDVPVNSYN